MKWVVPFGLVEKEVSVCTVPVIRTVSPVQSSTTGTLLNDVSVMVAWPKADGAQVIIARTANVSVSVTRLPSNMDSSPLGSRLLSLVASCLRDCDQPSQVERAHAPEL